MTHYQGEIPDPFEAMLREAGDEGARLAFTVTRGREDFGRTKVSCTLAITCPQKKASLDQAAALAFDTALNYANNALRFMAPEEPWIYGPLSPPQGGRHGG